MNTQIQQAELLQTVYQNRAPFLDAINRAAPWHALHRKRTLEILHDQLKATTRVLDLACGTGILASIFADRVAHTTLVDLLPLMIDCAKINLQAHTAPSNTSFHVAGVDSLPTDVLKSQYDLIMLTQAINFIEDTSPIFGVASKCLAPQGILHIDIDNPLRWIIVEALSGNLKNAQSIASTGRDAARNIVGAEYWFHSREQLISQAQANGLHLHRTFGIGAISTLIHIFNQSSDFLSADKLDPRAKPFLDESTLNELYNLDLMLESTVPHTAAGWSIFQFKKDGADNA